MYSVLFLSICYPFVSVEFPVTQETLTRLLLDNELESDIFKVVNL